MSGPGIGDQIRTLRTNKGWSQRRLAEEAGLSGAAVSQIETGRFVPKVETLEALAAALDADLLVSLASSEAGMIAGRIAQLWAQLDEAERGTLTAFVAMLEASHHRRRAASE